MNTLKAVVEEIKSDEFFSCITVRANNTELKLLKTEAPKWLRVGDEVECRVQEASIAICKGAKEGSVSIENHLSGELQHFRKGMELCEGCNVTLLLKAVDIKLMPLLGSTSFEQCTAKFAH